MGAVVGLWVQFWDFGCSCGSLGKFVVFWELWYFGYRSWGVVYRIVGFRIEV